MDEKPLILVTNDDGMFAPGLRALVESVRTLGRVIVVSPDSPQSGKGHAITLREPIRVHKVDPFRDIEAYECSGTPVDCVKWAKNVLLKEKTIDLCVSGINHGANHSINILYSGTMSAAMEAAMEGIHSIGFSYLDFSFEADFTIPGKFATKISKYMLGLEKNPQKPILLNVNIPNINQTEIKGIKVCRQSNARWVEEFQPGIDPRGMKYYWLSGQLVNNDKGENTDSRALDEGYVSVVPAQFDLTDYGAFDSLKGLSDAE
ncbi:5'/3'-nucleotidase SurE [Membranihabitans maritimus]|uniref:5'/3'-nucleotidase SurE n=1 Tax=Membranihabitans maritimus TaxID=2904244 RepID=UPI001F01D9A1|nr:5'/3'-nucleotidase SurE [Membranihabitans maritimus]